MEVGGKVRQSTWLVVNDGSVLSCRVVAVRSELRVSGSKRLTRLWAYAGTPNDKAGTLLGNGRTRADSQRGERVRGAKERGMC